MKLEYSDFKYSVYSEDFCIYRDYIPVVLLFIMLYNTNIKNGVEILVVSWGKQIEVFKKNS